MNKLVVFIYRITGLALCAIALPLAIAGEISSVLTDLADKIEHEIRYLESKDG